MREHAPHLRGNKRRSRQSQQCAGENIQEEHGRSAGANPVRADSRKIAKELVPGKNAGSAYGSKKQAGYIVHGQVLKQLDLQSLKVPKLLKFNRFCAFGSP
jgi:hypothetical protein